MLAKNRDRLPCNLSTSTLADAATFPQFTEFMEGQAIACWRAVFEFVPVGAAPGWGRSRTRARGAARERGYRSLDTTDLRVEPRDLAERGFRRQGAGLLLNRTGTLSDIHPQDFAGLLGRHNVELIAAKIETPPWSIFSTTT